MPLRQLKCFTTLKMYFMWQDVNLEYKVRCNAMICFYVWLVLNALFGYRIVIVLNDLRLGLGSIILSVIIALSSHDLF